MANAIPTATLGTGGVPNLRILTDYALGKPETWFDLHTAVHVGEEGADLLDAILPSGSATLDAVLAALCEHGTIVDQLHLKLLVEAAMLPPALPADAPPAAVRGTGGVPNVRVIRDYAAPPEPTCWFEIHTAVRLTPGVVRDVRDVLKEDLTKVPGGPTAAAAKGKAARLYGHLLKTNAVTHPKHLRALLEAALAHDDSSQQSQWCPPREEVAAV